MATFESELKRLGKNIRRLSSFALFPKKIKVLGKGNFVLQGPNIIVGNHIGSQKDVGLLFKIVPRPIFFTANKMIFNKEDLSFLVRTHLYRHLKDFGLVLHLLLNPFYALAVYYISSNIAKIGSIPVDLGGGRAESIKLGEDYLRKGRAIIALQGRGRVDSRDANPYIKRFRHGASVMAYDLYQGEHISVPVTPLAIFGTHIPFPVPATVKVNVGAPMYVKDHMMGSASETIEAFRSALEKRVNSLFMEIIRI